MTVDWEKRINEEVEVLQQARDEIRVQLHLAAADARDVWDTLEKKWEHLESRLERVSQTTREASEDVEEAVKGLVGEIRSGYKRIRDAM